MNDYDSSKHRSTSMASASHDRRYLLRSLLIGPMQEPPTVNFNHSPSQSRCAHTSHRATPRPSHKTSSIYRITPRKINFRSILLLKFIVILLFFHLVILRCARSKARSTAFPTVINCFKAANAALIPPSDMVTTPNAIRTT